MLYPAISRTCADPRAAAAILLVVGLLLLGKVPLGYNLRNLTVRWKTTLMTALAFTLVIALLTVMLAFVNGMYALTQGVGPSGERGHSLRRGDRRGVQQHEAGGRRGHRSPAGRRPRRRRPPPGQPRNLPDRQPGASRRRRRASRKDGDSNSAASRTRKWPPRCIACPCIRAGNGSPTPAWKRLPNRSAAEDSRRSAVQVVLGEAIARELGRGRAAEQLASARNRERLDVGDTFSLDERTWIVVGVMQPSGSTFDSEIWAKGGVIGPMFGKETYTTVDRPRRRRRHGLDNSKTSTPITTRRPPFRPRSRPTTSPTSAKATGSSSTASPW